MKKMDYTNYHNARVWAAKGMSVKDIAKMLGCTQQTVYNYLKLDPVDYWKEQEKRQRKMERIIKKARKILKGGKIT